MRGLHSTTNPAMVAVVKRWDAWRVVLSVAACGWLAADAETVPMISFSEVPSLTNGPGKGCYALFQGKLFEVQVTTNLDLIVYPVENGKRSDYQIAIYNYFTTLTSGLRFVGVLKPDPPSLNPQKLVFRAVTDQGAQLVQTWKISDGQLIVNNLFKEYTGAVPTMRMVVRFPQTHNVKANAAPAERSAITAGCAIRVRAGRADNAMKIITVPYGDRIIMQNCYDWMEHKGPWGNRKVTVKRSTSKGLFTLGGSVYGYEGVTLIFATRFDSLKRGELQGFEFKVE